MGRRVVNPLFKDNIRPLRVLILVLAIGLAPAACQLPKFAAAPVQDGMTPEPQSSPDTVVARSPKKTKARFGDKVLVYAVALVVIALLYLEIDKTDAH